jgi:hypothetical protein
MSLWKILWRLLSSILPCNIEKVALYILVCILPNQPMAVWKTQKAARTISDYFSPSFSRFSHCQVSYKNNWNWLQCDSIYIHFLQFLPDTWQLETYENDAERKVKNGTNRFFSLFLGWRLKIKYCNGWQDLSFGHWFGMVRHILFQWQTLEWH